MSAPEVERVIAAAHAAGALGAKLTGGGTGGAVIALAADPEGLAAALEEQEVQTMIVRVGRVVEDAAA